MRTRASEEALTDCWVWVLRQAYWHAHVSSAVVAAMRPAAHPHVPPKTHQSGEVPYLTHSAAAAAASERIHCSNNNCCCCCCLHHCRADPTIRTTAVLPVPLLLLAAKSLSKPQEASHARQQGQKAARQATVRRPLGDACDAQAIPGDDNPFLTVPCSWL
jgi:hypothetical protein